MSMNELISKEEIDFKAWEPRVQNRFICYINGIPSYVIKSIDRPVYNKKTKKWRPIVATFYEPIGTNVVHDLYKLPEPFDTTVKMLGPVGDVIDQYTMKDCRIRIVAPGILNWSDNGNPCLTTAKIEYRGVKFKKCRT